MASQLQGYEFEQALGVGEGQGSLACCSPWGCKELDVTEATERTAAFPVLHYLPEFAQNHIH